jgi:hypothetical protein
MQLWYPGAAKKPLGTQTEPQVSGGVPRVLIFHTMSGFLAGSDSWFRRDGYSGTESHFGVGGSWDKDLDGVVWQWQALDRQADAQYGGNAYATSVETSDGAKSGVPWTDKQVAALINLGEWWCRQTGNPARLVTAPTGSGFGYHSQFPAWNQAGHACPGALRVRQLTEVIIPAVARRLLGNASGGTKNSTEAIVKKLPTLARGAKPGEDMQTLRALLLARAHPEVKTIEGGFDDVVDKAVRAVQKWGGIKEDGVVGGATWRVLLLRERKG